MEAQRLGVPLEEELGAQPRAGGGGECAATRETFLSQTGSHLSPQAWKGCLHSANGPFCPSSPSRQPTQPSTLGLPTPVQNKVLRLLMIKMSPARCPSAIGL